ncbi:hypothetical protein QCA50_016668 [Cerrena zonata]|uniref:Prolactin receptor n=1 Tax=Cerrena zonata TaxID=2478898 RepID=A0AAW0FKS6_9APHY
MLHTTENKPPECRREACLPNEAATSYQRPESETESPYAIPRLHSTCVALRHPNIIQDDESTWQNSQQDMTKDKKSKSPDLPRQTVQNLISPLSSNSENAFDNASDILSTNAIHDKTLWLKGGCSSLQKFPIFDIEGNIEDKPQVGTSDAEDNEAAYLSAVSTDLGNLAAPMVPSFSTQVGQSKTRNPKDLAQEETNAGCSACHYKTMHRPVVCCRNITKLPSWIPKQQDQEESKGNRQSSQQTSGSHTSPQNDTQEE